MFDGAQILLSATVQLHFIKGYIITYVQTLRITVRRKIRTIFLNQPSKV